MLKSIQSHPNLTYLNNDKHTHLDKRTGNTDILDMAFISPDLTKHDISSEINHTESWRKIKNFLKPKGQRDYPALHLDARTARTNADKA